MIMMRATTQTSVKQHAEESQMFEYARHHVKRLVLAAEYRRSRPRHANVSARRRTLGAAI